MIDLRKVEKKETLGYILDHIKADPMRNPGLSNPLLKHTFRGESSQQNIQQGHVAQAIDNQNQNLGKEKPHQLASQNTYLVKDFQNKFPRSFVWRRSH